MDWSKLSVWFGSRLKAKKDVQRRDASVQFMGVGYAWWELMWAIKESKAKRRLGNGYMLACLSSAYEISL